RAVVINSPLIGRRGPPHHRILIKRYKFLIRQYPQYVIRNPIQLRPDDKRTLQRCPQREMTPALLKGQIPVPNLQHIPVTVSPEVTLLPKETGMVEDGHDSPRVVEVAAPF